MLTDTQEAQVTSGSCDGRATSDARDAIIVALDCSKEEALHVARTLKGRARWLKVGMTLYYKEGPAIVAELKSMGYNVFLDLKLHDIPHQVHGACQSAIATGADIISIHALGGYEMMNAAITAAHEAREAGAAAANIIAISVLTSMNEQALCDIGIHAPVADEVETLARVAKKAGINGMVCSAWEVERLSELFCHKGLFVVPGIRLAHGETNDQQRVATPSFAKSHHATHIVVGRPILQAPDMCAAFDAIAADWERC